MVKMKYIAALFFLFPVSVVAWDDDYRSYVSAPSYQQPYRPLPSYRQTSDVPKQKESFVYKMSEDLFSGAVKGDYIKSPNLANIIGNLIVNFTPLAPVSDSRDFVANMTESFKTNFKEHKKDVAISAAGFIPLVGEMKKFGAAYEAGRALRYEAKVIKATDKYISASLPPLKSEYAAAFDGLSARTFRKGEIIYRSPTNAALEPARSPRRWFGLAETQTKQANNVFYNHEKFNNANNLIRKYEFTQDTTVYYGKVKGGIGYQVYIPDNIKTMEVLKWRGSTRIR